MSFMGGANRHLCVIKVISYERATKMAVIIKQLRDLYFLFIIFRKQFQ